MVCYEIHKFTSEWLQTVIVILIICTFSTCVFQAPCFVVWRRKRRCDAVCKNRLSRRHNPNSHFCHHSDRSRIHPGTKSPNCTAPPKTFVWWAVSWIPYFENLSPLGMLCINAMSNFHLRVFVQNSLSHLKWEKLIWKNIMPYTILISFCCWNLGSFYFFQCVNVV